MKRIGIIGAGGIAMKTHVPQLLDIADCKITAVCDIDAERLKNAGEELGLDKEHQFSDYKALIDSGLVDAVEVCTPNHKHVEIAEYAVSKGVPVNVEKPLGISVSEGERLEALLAETNLLNMMCFSYRFFPAVRYAKSIIDNGGIGDIISIDVKYFKSSALWEGRRLEWRFVKKYAGTGVLGDLAVHLIDMAQLLAGDFKSVCADLGIVVKKRQKLDCDEWGDVETDDYCNFIAKLKSRTTDGDIPATFSVTRCAIGHANTISYDIFGTDGVISFNLNDPKVLDICEGRKGKLHTVDVPKEFYITQEQAFIDSLNGKFCEYFPTVSDGVKCQKILEAIEKSAEENSFVNI